MFGETGCKCIDSVLGVIGVVLACMHTVCHWKCGSVTGESFLSPCFFFIIELSEGRGALVTET